MTKEQQLHRTPKGERWHNPTKPAPKPKKEPKPLRTKTPLRPCKPGQRPLQHKRKVAGHTIKALQQRTDTLKRGGKLKVVGRRGKRLQPGDRKQEATTHVMPCYCGCNAHLQPGADGVPGKGLVSRAHLESRRFESTRNEDWNNIPACLHLADWLDHTRQGGQAKADLLVLAKEKQSRLTPEEVRPVLTEHGYTTWLADRRQRER